MTPGVKAALLSGLIFPGTGHMILKQYLRGSVLMLAALAALWVIVQSAFQQAQTIVDQIYAGDIPLDSGAIAEAVANPSAGANAVTDNIALIILVVCWLIGIIDSYRLGAAGKQ